MFHYPHDLTRTYLFSRLFVHERNASVSAKRSLRIARGELRTRGSYWLGSTLSAHVLVFRALMCRTSTYAPGNMTRYKRDAAMVHVTAANIIPLNTPVHIFRSRSDIQINRIRSVRRHNEPPRGKNNSMRVDFFYVFAIPREILVLRIWVRWELWYWSSE